MTELAAHADRPADVAATAERPSPAGALEQRFNQIWVQQMHGLPMLNPALRVQALGFRPWQQHWLGVLVTPWFMNLLLFPRVVDAWPATGLRESRYHVFPAGVFEFIGNRDPVLGDYQACSLFSPMFEFADTAAAQATAEATLVALFDAAHRLPSDAPAAETPAPASAAASPAPALSKREFLLGNSRRERREP